MLDCTIGFMRVSAVGKPAIVYKRINLGEERIKPFRFDSPQVHFAYTGCVRYVPSDVECEHLDLSGCVASFMRFLTHLPHMEAKSRLDQVEYARFTDT